jgi:membrane associated rhomboid family serine protease
MSLSPEFQSLPEISSIYYIEEAGKLFIPLLNPITMRIPEGLDFDWWALKLTGVCVAVFALSQLFPQLYGSLTLVSSDVFARPWTIVTHMFMHADLPHLYFNMFALAVFGSMFEKCVGSRTFLTVFFLGGFASTAADIIFYPSTLGASGAIFAVLGCLALFRPRTVVWAMGVPMYVIAAFFIWAAIDLVGMFNPDNIAHASHLAGMGYGGLYAIWLRKQHPEPRKPVDKEAEDIPTEEELDEWERKWMC